MWCATPDLSYEWDGAGEVHAGRRTTILINRGDRKKTETIEKVSFMSWADGPTRNGSLFLCCGRAANKHHNTAATRQFSPAQVCKASPSSDNPEGHDRPRARARAPHQLAPHDFAFYQHQPSPRGKNKLALGWERFGSECATATPLEIIQEPEKYAQAYAGKEASLLLECVDRRSPDPDSDMVWGVKVKCYAPMRIEDGGGGGGIRSVIKTRRDYFPNRNNRIPQARGKIG